MTSYKISEADLAGGLAHGKTYTLSHPVSAAVKPCVEQFIGTYEAVRKVTQNTDVALYLAALETARTIQDKPLSVPAYDSPKKLFGQEQLSAAKVAGYCHALVERLSTVICTSDISAVSIGARVYTLTVPVYVPSLVGLDREREQFYKYVRQLFLYDPKTQENPDKGRFPLTLLLTGPPGTGKSSLLQSLFAEGKRLRVLTGTPFSFFLYDSAQFSSYFGRSQRILKRNMSTVQDPNGVGIFAIEDVDMVLQSRDDAQKLHGVQQIQQFLLNQLSGFVPARANMLTVLSTNKVEHLDDALVNRCERQFVINPFTEVATHDDFFRIHCSSLAPAQREVLARLSHAAQFTGRDLAAICSSAREATTRAPTDEELQQRSQVNRYGFVSAELLETLIAERRAARRS